MSFLVHQLVQLGCDPIAIGRGQASQGLQDQAFIQREHLEGQQAGLGQSGGLVARSVKGNGTRTSE